MTGNCPQPVQVVQQPVQVVQQQTVNTVTCGQGNNCCKPPMPELVGKPKPIIKPGSEYLIRKITAKKAPPVSFAKTTIKPEVLEVPCMHEHETVVHTESCPPGPDCIPIHGSETVFKVEWDTTVIQEAVKCSVANNIHVHITFENEQPRVTAEFLLVRQPKIRNEDQVRVQKCRDNIAAEEIVNRGNCDQEAVVQVPAQPSCATSGCAAAATPCATGNCNLR